LSLKDGCGGPGAADDAVKAPAAQLVTAAGQADNYSASTGFNRSQQAREAVAQGAATGRVVVGPVWAAVLNQHRDTVWVTAGDLSDQCFVCVRRVDDCQEVTHGRESALGLLKRH
jgi:hypothetical protein